jgi:hypothetical protein
MMLCLSAQAADFTVTSNANTGAGTLRQALTDAAALAGEDRILFAPALSGQTIEAEVFAVAGAGNVSAFVIDDTDGVIIDGSDLAAGITLTKKNVPAVPCRLFYVRQKLTVRGMTLASAGGDVPGGPTPTVAGGAILNKGTLVLENCTLRGNTGNTGGAIYNSGTATLTQCTLTQNLSDLGGAIFNAGAMKLTHCTIAGNTSNTVGGGIVAHQPLTLEVSIVSGNTGSNGADLFNPALITHTGVNLVEHLSSETNVTGIGTFIRASALLAPLGNYGGPTQTMPPLPNSPALDQAIATQPATTTDQRGSPRPLGLRPDIGAVEGRVLVVNTAVDELDALGVPGTGYSLREALRDVEVGGSIAFDRGLFHGANDAANTLTLTLGPLNPQRACILDGSINPGGIRIQHAATITTQPQDVRVTSGSATSMTVAVTAVNGGLTWQWIKDGSPVAGATSSTLPVASAAESDEGLYEVQLGEAAPAVVLTLTQVTVAPLSARSDVASLVVDAAPVTVLRQPVGGILPLGAAHTFEVIAVGPDTAPLKYQWYKNGRAISGATQAILSMPALIYAHAGAYFCAVGSGRERVLSSTALLAVVQTQRKVVHVAEGARFTATALAMGSSLGYDWRLDGSALGVTTKSLLIPSVTIKDSGLYTCTISSTAGSHAGAVPTQLYVSSAVPQLGTITLPEATVGQGYYYQIPVVDAPGAPVQKFIVTGLPDGLSVDADTGLITGRPMALNRNGFTVRFSAMNASGTSTVTTATLTVNALPATALGQFTGFIQRSVLNENLGGKFDLRCTANGMVSGSLLLGAKRIPFVNELLVSYGKTDIMLRTDLAQVKMVDGTPLVAYFEVSAAEQYARLTLVHPDGTTQVTRLWRNPWVSDVNPALYRAAFRYAAQYSLRLDAGDGGAVSPSGYGFAHFTVGSFGELTMMGKLPDGNVITTSTFVGERGEVLLHQLVDGEKGSCLGQLTITPATNVMDNVLIGLVSWSKPAVARSTIYKDGFLLRKVLAEGGVYVPPAAGQRLLALPAVVAPALNAELSFDLGGVVPFAQSFRITNPSATGLTNTATVDAYNPRLSVNPNPNVMKVTALDVSKGTFSGSFMMVGSTSSQHRPAVFHGQVVKIGAETQGWGFFLLPSAPVGREPVASTPKLSGAVELKSNRSR